jgi:Predicted acyltransferases
METLESDAKVIDLKPLTSLRFVAAMMIVVYHAKNYFMWSWIKHAPFTLMMGVSFFFVLSGFILTHVYTSKAMRSYGHFIRARIARLWPLHIATLILLVTTVKPDSITFDGPGVFSKWITLGFNLVLMQSLVPFVSYIYSWNAVSWSISTEMSFYLLFPFLLKNIRRTWGAKLIAAAFAFATLLICLLIIRTPFDGGINQLTIQSATYANPLTRCFEFCAGMAAWVIWNTYVRDVRISTLAWSSIELVVITMTALWLWKYYFVINAWLSDPNLSQVLRLSGSAWLFAILIICFASGRGYLGKLLSARICVFLGEISFAVYMAHQVLMKASISWLPKESIHTPTFLCVLLIASTALHLCIEKPCRNILLGTKRQAHDRSLKAVD